MNLTEVKDFYAKIIEKERLKYAELKKRIFNTGTLRLLVVLIGIVVVYGAWGNTPAVVAGMGATAVVFAALMLYHNRLYKRRLYAEIQVRNAENELKGIDYDFSAFDGAPEKIEQGHSFSLDLDLFGNRSFFQSLNRTVTSFGKDYLANALSFPLGDKQSILHRQDGIKELAAKPRLLAHFRTTGQMMDAGSFNRQDFLASFSQAPYFYGSKFWAAMIYAVPALYVLLGAFYLSGIVVGTSFLYLWIILLVFSSIPMKKSMKLFGVFDKKTAMLDTYSRLFEILENEDFKAQLLRQNQQELNGVHKASRAIAQLKSCHNNLGLSATFPVILFLNPVLLWNVRYALQIEKWLQQHKNDINNWFGALARFDALISMAVFAYNHPGYIYPEVSESFVFEGKKLGHPLIHRDVCVRNDVQMLSKPCFRVITGANMAGKSTYLRTIGINHLLACTGMPVCAESLSFNPCQLVTNLRTADSLADNESYFFAELKRLKMIIDRLQAGEELFIILDEILKGTNSEDKQKGSLALMRQLLRLNGTGIIATHDLMLGKLEDEFPQHVKDYCFEADIVDNHLSFSYQVREGIAQNMNACFLMKKMGITV
ncbi:MutS-related protein [Viscerimonas tarda]